MYDLLVRARRIVCPSTGLETSGAVAVVGDRIVAAGADVDGPAKQTLDFPEETLLPGLVDLHAHPARGGSKYGVDPDLEFLPRGVTTVLSQGDAGAENLSNYLKTTIAACRTRVKLAINLSFKGESMDGGCFENLDWVDVAACVSAIQSAHEHIWGIAINLSVNCCRETDPKEVLRRGLQVAEETGKPLLYGICNPNELSWDEQMELLRPGDVMTYLYRRDDWSIVNETGRVHSALIEARNRGVLFDVGHGMTSFDFRVAEAALADGFGPDTVSTDQYLRHTGSTPQHDLPRTMSKLLAAGMNEADIFRAVTTRPAEILDLEDEIGSLASGTCADLTVLRFNQDAQPLQDINGTARPGGCWEAVCTIRNGVSVSR
jgi:dihydroorotase